jgi:type II secretory ATPase GspE/PulE/Tfp pilus assembly ATPase PilB-like protein
MTRPQLNAQTETTNQSDGRLFDPPRAEPDAPKVLETLVRKAESAGASDIHLQMIGREAVVTFRLDGLMTPVSRLADPLAERVFGRIKFLARLKTYQEMLPQDGRIDKGELQARNDIRVATYPTVTGEKIVLRLFTQTQAQTLRELRLPEAVCDELERFLRGSSGLLLLTGPAGSGKTTTIYACLHYLAELGGRHVVTVEDPAEQIIPGWRDPRRRDGSPGRPGGIDRSPGDLDASRRLLQRRVRAIARHVSRSLCRLFGG